jgi:ANTAR domain
LAAHATHNFRLDSPFEGYVARKSKRKKRIMDHSVVHLLTHPDPYSGIDSDRLLKVIIDVAGSAVIEFEPEYVIPEVCVETAGALGIAGCAVVEFDDVSCTVRTAGWSSPLAGELAGDLAGKLTGENVRSVVDVICGGVSVGSLDPLILRAAAAAREGIEAVAAVPLRCGCTRHGCMYLFGRTIQLNDTLVAAGGLVAAVLGAVTGNAAMCRRSAALAVQLSKVLETRIPIEQAKGLLAERFGIGVDEAFRTLQAHSRRTRMPMFRMAQSVLDGATVVVPAQRGAAKG